MKGKASSAEAKKWKNGEDEEKWIILFKALWATDILTRLFAESYDSPI